MKWLTQIALPIAIVIAVIAGGTFVSHYTGRGKNPNGSAPTHGDPANAFALQPRPGTTWVTASGAEPEDYELHRPGQRDFWFQQPHSQPVAVGLSYKGCACSELALAVLTPAEAAEPMAKVNLAPERWQPLKVSDDPSVTLPAAQDAPVVGVIRLSWKGRQPGPEGLAFRVWTEIGSGQRQGERFRHPVNFVPALQVFPTQATLPESGPRTVEFWCWSRTRPEFPLQAVLQGGMQGFACQTRVATDAEKAALPREIEASTVRGLHRVRVTLSNTDGLDLGPLERRLVLTSTPTDEPVYALVDGTVRGPIKVGAARDKDMVDLGAFAARKGTQRRIPVEAEEAGVTLELAGVSPPYLDVKLESLPEVDGRGRWQLAVAVPPGAAAGRLPHDSAVMLTLPGMRRLRIPIAGQATQ